MGIRLVVVDDNPHLRWQGRVHPVNATFHRFVAGLLDAPGAPVAAITHVVPLGEATDAPGTLPLDPRVRVVGTAPFDGIAGYLRSVPSMLRANRGPIRRALAEADLLWLKVPASNAPLAAALAVRAGVPRFLWVAGSAREVARARFRGPRAVAASLVGAAYDAAGWAAGVGGDRVVVGAGLDGTGLVSSLVDPGEIVDHTAAPWPRQPGRLRLAWAGRLAWGKGIETVLEALAQLVAVPPDGRHVDLVLLGDGPARADLMARARLLGVADRLDWQGYVDDRRRYLELLGSADVFVFPSPAEGFPKVVLDAFAAGSPVIAAPSGSLVELGPGRLELVAPGDPEAMTGAVRRLAADPRRARELRAGGAAFVRAHTRDAEIARLVERWRARHPRLPWDA